MADKKYTKYLQSKEWKKISLECKTLAENKCSRCGSNKKLEAHHKTYDRIYNESQDDLECLCHDCHMKHHKENDIKIQSFDRRIKISFIMVGSGDTHYKIGLKTIDLWDEAQSMTKAEIFTINMIKNNMVWGAKEISKEKYTNGLSYIPASKFDIKSQRTIFQKGMKLLKEKELAIKVDRNTYMLHPLALIPTEIEEGMRIWNECWENE